MSERRFGYAELGIGLLLGLAIGSVVGLLFAPQSGERTRGRIASTASGLRTSAGNMLEQAKDSLEAASHYIERAVGLEDRNIRRKLDELKAELEEYDLTEA